MAHGKGQGHIGNLGIHRRLTGQAHGDAGDAHGGIHVRPAQLLDGQGGAGKDGVLPLVGQIPEALSGFFCQVFKAGEADVSGAVPADLEGQLVCLVPVVFRGLGQLTQGVGGGLHTDVIGKGAGIIVQAEDQHVQHVDSAARRQHPAEPGDGVPLKEDHQHDAGQHDYPQHHRQQLPQAEVHLAAPLGQGGLEGADDIGVNHIHQGGELFAVAR